MRLRDHPFQTMLDFRDPTYFFLINTPLSLSVRTVILFFDLRTFGVVVGTGLSQKKKVLHDHKDLSFDPSAT